MSIKEKIFNKEVLRFIVVGIIATIVDYLFYSLFAFLSKLWGIPEGSFWITFIATAMGFIAGVIVNYILSLLWVFQDVDKEHKMNKYLHAVIFVLLSAIGLLIGFGIMALFKFIFLNTLHIDIDTWMVIDNNNNWIVEVLSKPDLYLFTLAFVIKTLIVLIYNYISRKKILFKSAKK